MGIMDLFQKKQTKNNNSKTDIPTDVPTDDFLELIKDFCDITILRTNIPPFFTKLTAEDMLFIKKVKSFKGSINNDIYYSLIIVQVNEYSSKHLSQAAVSKENPFSNISKEFLYDYYQAVRKELKTIDSVLLKFLDFTYQCIENQRLQFESLNIVLNNQIEFLKEREISRLETRVDAAVETIKDTTDAVNDNFDKLGKINGQIKKLNIQLTNATNKFKKATKTVENLDNTIENAKHEVEKNMTTNHITILGIFSAIVLTFNAGVSFASIVLENLISASAYRAIIITLIFAAIIGNAILGLFAYLEYVRKNQEETQNDDKSKKLIHSITFWVVLIVNFLIIVSVIVTFFAWKLGCIESRNYEISSKYSTEITETTTVPTSDSNNIEISKNEVTSIPSENISNNITTHQYN